MSNHSICKTNIMSYINYTSIKFLFKKKNLTVLTNETEKRIKIYNTRMLPE